jgi:hypothetical protein
MDGGCGRRSLCLRSRSGSSGEPAQLESESAGSSIGCGARVRLRGINYDTGIAPFRDRVSRPSFDPDQVRREIAVIARDLHCNAIRITGADPGRIARAAEVALAEGLETWFAPFPCNMTAHELVPFFAAAARAAELLRRRSPRVVFVTGCETTVFNSGFVPGDDQLERMRTIMNPAGLVGKGVSLDELVRRFDASMADNLAAVRASFRGPVTYASGPWEPVDWSRFDIVGVDLYRDAGNREAYAAEARAFLAHGRPVVVTEAGCCTYRGAQDRGAMGWAIVDRDARPPRLREAVVRDEQVQADYLIDVLRILDGTGIDGAFWFTFAGFDYPHSADPQRDLDCASYGVVKMLESGSGQSYPGLPWEPKRVFRAMAECYADTAP